MKSTRYMPKDPIFLGIRWRPGQLPVLKQQAAGCSTKDVVCRLKTNCYENSVYRSYATFYVLYITYQMLVKYDLLYVIRVTYYALSVIC